MGVLEVISGLFGWVYTLSWSLSFYPQPLLNYQRGTTAGTTVDFPLINVLGFAAYLASNAAFYYSPLVRAQYAARHHGLTPTVAFNDVMFALHAVLLAAITTSQYLLPRPWGLPASRRPSRTVLGIMTGSVLGVVLTTLFVAGRHGADAATDWCALDVVYAVGYVKLLITLVKYAPQVVTNARNKSTDGWSIWQILLDGAGGGLSVAQQGIDSFLQRDWSGITGNPVKFALGNVSMLYDVVFVVQHYVVYRGRKPEDGERRGLLEGENGNEDTQSR